MNKSNNRYYTIYGINGCINFLSIENNYNIKSINICKNGQAHKNGDIIHQINKLNITPNILDKELFNSKFNFKHSQGIVIQFSGLIEKDISKKSFQENSCLLIADQIQDPQNLGQIIRTCECAGISGIVLHKHRSVLLTDTVLQVSQGAFMLLDIFIEHNLVNTINYLKNEGFWVVGVENSIKSKEWFDIDYKGKIAIVVGSEGKGIRELVKKNCDFLATIPMKGKINSLNVSAALSAILFERQRQLSKSK